MQTVQKLEAFVIMGQNSVINIVTPCDGYGIIILAFGLLSYIRRCAVAKRI
jgi:hypothetical protein